MVNKIAESFTQLLNEQRIHLSDRQMEQFDLYYTNLVEWNEKMNLTGITDREQVYVKHFYDSVSLSFFVPLNEVATIADIGSGAGFPSIPLKIVYPHMQVTIVDSLNKRIQFLEHLTGALGLSEVECIHGRAEDLGRNPKYRDKHDLVTARAVARLAVLGEFCLPFVKPGGLFAAMKGTNPEEEIAEAEYGVKQLNGKLKSVHSFELPLEHSSRHIIVFEKISPTPVKYPRKAGVPIKTPLIKP